MLTSIAIVFRQWVSISGGKAVGHSTVKHLNEQTHHEGTMNGQYLYGGPLQTCPDSSSTFILRKHQAVVKGDHNPVDHLNWA